MVDFSLTNEWLQKSLDIYRPMQGFSCRDRAPSLAQHWVYCCVVRFSLRQLPLSVSAVQVAVGCTCLAIAQMKPDSSRAIAAVITVGSFPARASLRYRRHSRS